MPEASEPIDVLIRRLSGATRLSAADEAAVRRLPVMVRKVATGKDIVHEGGPSSHCCIVLDGWLCCYQTLAAGKRQIVSIYLPGELPDLQTLHLPHPDFGMGAMTTATIAFVPHSDLRALMAGHPAVAAALWREALITAAIYRTWITGLGRRDGRARLAHLFCEMYLRLSASGLETDGAVPLPIRQHDIADMLGQTSVHINRSLRTLRDDGLIVLRDRKLTIKDWPGLCSIAEFDGRYLHIGTAA